jgi:hypothetical protein
MIVLLTRGQLLMKLSYVNPEAGGALEVDGFPIYI